MGIFKTAPKSRIPDFQPFFISITFPGFSREHPGSSIHPNSGLLFGTPIIFPRRGVLENLLEEADEALLLPFYLFPGHSWDVPISFPWE
jgi:hypothetical protein